MTTSTPLMWEEKMGVLMAHAHGFKYVLEDNTATVVALGVWLEFTSKNVSIKVICQSHADMVSSAIADAVSEERKLADIMADSLKAVSKDSPTSLPEDNRGCGNEDDAYLSGADREHYRLASLTTEALKAHAEARK